MPQDSVVVEMENAEAEDKGEPDKPVFCWRNPYSGCMYQYSKIRLCLIVG